MGNIEAQLQKKIMRRVYVIYALRQLFAPVMLRVYVLAAALTGLFSFVSVGDVLVNMPTYGLAALYDFSTYALMHTDHVVQILLAIMAAVFIFLIRDVVRSIAHLTMSRQAV